MEKFSGELHLDFFHLNETKMVMLFKAIDANTTIKSLSLRRNNIRTEVISLEKNTTLTKLDLTNNMISDMKKLSEWVIHNTSLTSLNLSANHIETEGALLLIEALKNNSTVAELKLRANKIYYRGVENLPSNLAENTSLTSLSLSRSFCTREGVKMIAEIIRTNTSLKILNLRNIATLDSMKWLIEACKTNTSLTKLNFGFNDITFVAATELANVLKTNTSLRYLNLKHTRIKDGEAKLLADAIKTNTTLAFLNLPINAIEDEGCIAFAESLKYNTSLRALNLSFNSIKNVGAEALVQSLGVNTALTGLYLGDNSEITHIKQELWAQKIKYNVTLLDLGMDEKPPYIENSIQRNESNMDKLVGWIHKKSLLKHNAKIPHTERGYVLLYQCLRSIFDDHIFSTKSSLYSPFQKKYMPTEGQSKLIDYLIAKNWLQLSGVCKTINSESPLYHCPSEIRISIFLPLKLPTHNSAKKSIQLS